MALSKHAYRKFKVAGQKNYFNKLAYNFTNESNHSLKPCSTFFLYPNLQISPVQVYFVTWCMA